MTELDAGTIGLVQRLARRVAILEQQTRDLGRASQARDRSVEGGAQSLYDEDDELRAVVGEQPDGSYTVVTYGGAPPAAPSMPLVSTFPGGATITWDGFDAADESSWPANFARVNVHMSTIPAAPATLDTLIASIESPGGGSVSVAQPSDVTTYVTFVAVTQAGLQSEQSWEAEVTGGEIPAGGDGGPLSFHTADPPLGLTLADEGVLWYEIDNGNRAYRWDGDTFEPVLIGRDALEGTLTARELGAMQTYSGATDPAADALPGDLWLKPEVSEGVAVNTLYRRNDTDTAWVKVDDPAVQTALEDAQAAANLADSKMAVYFQAAPPTVNNSGAALGVADTGDLWYESDNGNKAYRWDGDSWEPLLAGLAALASTVTARSLGGLTTYSGATDPAVAALPGDLWLKPETVNGVNVNTLYRRNDTDTAWVKVDDPTTQTALQNAQDAANLADSKMAIYYQAAPPTVNAAGVALGAADTGDLWYETDNDNKAHRWTGTAWTPVLIGANGTATDLLGGKTIPLDTAVELEWGIPNPATPLTGGTLVTGWKHINRLAVAGIGGSWTDKGGGLVLASGVWYGLAGDVSTYTDANGDLQSAVTVSVAGNDGSVRSLFTHSNVRHAYWPPVIGMTRIGTTWYVMLATWTGAALPYTYTVIVRRYDASWNYLGRWNAGVHAGVLNLTNDGTNVILARMDATEVNYVLEARNATTGAVVSSVSIAKSAMGTSSAATYFERGNFDFGATRYVAAVKDDTASPDRLMSFSTAGAAQAAEHVNLPAQNYLAAGPFAYDGAGRFVIGREYLFSSSSAKVTGTVWGSYAYRDTVTGQMTAAAPVSTTGVAVPSRSFIIVKGAAAFPPVVDESPAPNTSRVFLATSATAPALSTLRGVTAVEGFTDLGVERALYVEAPFTRDSVVPPVVSSFATGAAGALVAELGGFYVRGDSVGRWPYLEQLLKDYMAATYATAGHVHDNAEILAQLATLEATRPRSGRVTVTIPSGTAPQHGTQAITFDPPFPDEAVVHVVTNIYDVVNAGNFAAATEPGATPSGATLRVSRIGGAATSAQVEWVAMMEL